MTEKGKCRILAEELILDHRVQLVEHRDGSYYLRKILVDEGTVLFSAPVYGNAAVLDEARGLFPDFLPFGGLPVDAT